MTSVAVPVPLGQLARFVCVGATNTLRPATIPIARQPTTLIRKMPMGKPAPNRAWTTWFIR